MDLVAQVYEYTRSFPMEERYGLSSQIRRAAVSIPSNIAEGARRDSGKEFSRFLSIAYGSAAELETQLELSFRLRYSSFENKEALVNELVQIMKMIHVLRERLKSEPTPSS